MTFLCKVVSGDFRSVQQTCRGSASGCAALRITGVVNIRRHEVRGKNFTPIVHDMLLRRNPSCCMAIRRAAYDLPIIG